MTSHAEYGPSRLTSLVKCPCFISRPAGEAAHKGTLQHQWIEDTLTGKKPSVFIGPLDLKKVRWAVGWIRKNTTDDRHVELLLRARGKIARVEFGHSDIVDVLDDRVVVVDYKSGLKFDAVPQVAAYSLMAMQTFNKMQADAHLLYGKYKNIVSHSFTYDEATSIIVPILEEAISPDKVPRRCEYCGFCTQKKKCSAW